MTSEKAIRALAFYLPQFHPIPENDTWWGPGFTEWRNVAQAQPVVRGHRQPHLPGELGFYDLRLPQTREAQAALARDYGIHGFCYYHYWFNGQRLLNEPLDAVLESGTPDYPFCLCWANENWTRRWDGRDKEILIRQNYNEADDLAHIRWLARVFEDPRYIRVEGKPLFLVYAAGHLPDPLRTTETWREECRRMGIGDIFLCRVENFHSERGRPEQLGFDAAVEFQPDFSSLGSPIHRTVFERFLARFGASEKGYLENRVFDYAEVVRRMLSRPEKNYRCFPCVTPSWDNSPRRKKDAVILKGSTPEIYGAWLKETVRKTLDKSSSNDNLVFINAWNEWAEGAHLEPCLCHGRAYLEATAEALQFSPREVIHA